MLTGHSAAHCHIQASLSLCETVTTGVRSMMATASNCISVWWRSAGSIACTWKQAQSKRARCAPRERNSTQCKSAYEVHTCTTCVRVIL